MDKIEIGDIIYTNRQFKVFREFPDGTYDACDTWGNCLQFSKQEISKDNIMKPIKAMKSAVYGTATKLLKANGRVTNLEIKVSVRTKLPHYFWSQKIVSSLMDELYQEGKFSFTDNGQYRIYTPIVQLTNSQVAGNQPATSPSKTKTTKIPQSITIDKQKALDLVKQGPFINASIIIRGSSKFVDVQDIKAQKKSPFGYLQTKTIYSIQVGNDTYLVN